MKLSIVIVNYNVRFFLESALLSVRDAIKGIEAEVFVVDNNSVDDSVEMVKAKFPEIKVIANRENVGFSKANNQAIALAKGEYVLLLNPDTVVEEDTFSKCIAFMDAHPDAGGLGVRMIDGKSNFLPESKRGFPSPEVAFYKTFGLSKLFPKSPRFNRYHLGFLDEMEVHEVDVLSGAFMLMRKNLLDNIGYLDEAFFMYGEDIDLSYRIIKAGYKNYYFPETTIIHYKGESTKKGTLNYVKTFYQAMIIFARKHFSGQKAGMFVFMLQIAIWFRASITLLSNFLNNAFQPLLDGMVIYAGLYFIKDAWEEIRYADPHYFQPSLWWINFPLYVAIWLISIYFSGGYDRRNATKQVLQGIVFGTFVIAAVYGFLGGELRSSRMLILLGAAWSAVTCIALRILLHFLSTGKLMSEERERKNVLVVGKTGEYERTLLLLQKAQVEANIIGAVYPGDIQEVGNEGGKRFEEIKYLGNLYQLPEMVHLYDVKEIIFCGEDLSTQAIIRWMTVIGSDLDYKILPADSLSIIGSNSKNSAGDLYTVEVKFKISTPSGRRNKRMFDIGVSLLLMLGAPILLWFSPKKNIYFSNCLKVLFGSRSWVGYHSTNNDGGPVLPNIKKGVYSPLAALNYLPEDVNVIHKLNLLYAKDYSLGRDWDLLWKGMRRKN